MFIVFLLVLIPLAVLSCSAVSPGQEAQVMFQADGLITIPVEFAYSFAKVDVLDKFPKFSTTSSDSIKNLQTYMKNAVKLAITEEAKRAGVENLVSDIANQITPTVHYSPMNCSKADSKAIAPSGPGYACVVINDVITNVSYDAQNAVEIPEQFQQFIVSLTVLRYMWTVTVR
ncbi:hypothetical protein RB195_016654 [Necator americanus]|uniref:Uncharacterized protein n=1 Tax=Necator americanus TaxID=51031 RepID=A0ABR1C1H4_NECAM